MDVYEQRLGAAPFLVLRAPELLDEELRGQPYHPRQDLAFGYVGHLQLELIQPVAGGDASTYTEYLERHPEGGVHHTAIHVADLDEGLQALGLGRQDVLQSGRFGAGTRFAYVDAAGATGTLLELIELDDGGTGMFEGLHRGELGGA